VLVCESCWCCLALYFHSEPGYISVVMENALRSSLPACRVLYIRIRISPRLRDIIPVSAPNLRNLLGPPQINIPGRCVSVAPFDKAKRQQKKNKQSISQTDSVLFFVFPPSCYGMATWFHMNIR
jgi:hypothetical protein